MSFDGDLYFFFDLESPNAITMTDPDQWHGSPNDELLFNGDFEWGAPSGWDNHGGGGTASVDLLGAGDGWFLEMDFFTIERTHSFFWLPREQSILSFEYDITDNDVIDCDDDFKVGRVGHVQPGRTAHRLRVVRQDGAAVGHRQRRRGCRPPRARGLGHLGRVQPGRVAHRHRVGG